jgi:tetratricopeptide (TPR) repeat protein
MKVADTLRAMGKREPAIELYQRSLEHRKQLLARQPDDRVARRDIAVIQTKIAEASGEDRDMRPALPWLRDALQTISALAADAPDDAWAQRDLSIAQEKLASALASTGDPVTAKALLEQCLAIRQKLADADPTNATGRADVINARMNCAALAEQMNDFRGAVEYLETALSLCQKAPSDKGSRRSSYQRDKQLWQVQFSTGTVKAKLAAQANSPEQASRLWRDAAASIAASRDVILRMQTEGTAAPADDAMLPKVRQALEACQAHLLPATAPSTTTS